VIIWCEHHKFDNPISKEEMEKNISKEEMEKNKPLQKVPKWDLAFVKVENSHLFLMTLVLINLLEYINKLK